MKTFFKFITIAIYFFIIITVMNKIFSHQILIYYIITIPLLAIGVLIIDLIIKKFFKN